MNMVNGGGRDILEHSFTLTQAAQVLAIDNKTLQKRLAASGIRPIQPSYDQRLRLLTEDQVEQLKSPLDQVAKAPRAQTQMGATIKMVKKLERRISDIEEENQRLKAEVDARLADLDRYSRLLVVLADQLAAKSALNDTSHKENNGAQQPQPDASRK